MKEYLASYFQILESGHTLIGQVHKEFQNNCKEMTSDRLLEMFIKSKGVGAAKPGTVILVFVVDWIYISITSQLLSADIQFEEANPSNFQQLNNMPQLSVSTSSLSSKPANSSGYTSAVDLFNLDQLMTPQPGAHDFAIPSMDSSGGVGLGVHHLASTSSSSSLAFGAGLPSTSSSTSSSTLRKEGKATFNSTLLHRHAHRHAAAKHSTNAYELSKPNTLKQKRSAYSSRYALSLMDLFTSSNTPSSSSSAAGSSAWTGGSGSGANHRAFTHRRGPPSYTAQANAIISHVPACTASTVFSSLSTCKSVSIDHRVTTFGNIASHLLPSAAVWFGDLDFTASPASVI